MDSKRAKAILQSQAMINVSYYGIPIFIQEVDEGKQMAKVFPLDEMNNEQDVDLDGLYEV